MKAYLAIMFSLMGLLNWILVYLGKLNPNWNTGLIEMNILVGLNTIIAIAILKLKKIFPGSIHLIFLGSIPLRFVIFLVSFVIVKSMQNVILIPWVITYLIVFTVFHIVETGLLIHSLKQHEKQS